MNKYKNSIPRDDLKRFGKEIAKKLVASDYKAGRVTNPTKINEKQQKKVKEFCKQFFDKAAHKHKKQEEERAARKTKEGTTTSTPVAMSPASQDVSPNVKREESDDEDVKMSDHEVDTPSESNTLKRKRGDSSPVAALKEECEPGNWVVDKSPHKKVNVDTPPPPPPAPPVETPPASTPRELEGEMDVEVKEELEVEADLHDEGDTVFRDKSMADVKKLAQMEVEDDEGTGMFRGDGGIGR
jgi:[histone H3]-lysine36 N-trimethyltransferase